MTCPITYNPDVPNITKYFVGINELLICFNLRYKNEAKWRPAVSAVVKFFTVGGLLGNCLVTGLLLFISHHNYPGGVALQRLHTLLENQTGRRNTLRN